MAKRKLKRRWSCSIFKRHEHRWRWTAWICGRWQRLFTGEQGDERHETTKGERHLTEEEQRVFHDALRDQVLTDEEVRCSGCLGATVHHTCGKEPDADKRAQALQDLADIDRDLIWPES